MSNLKQQPKPKWDMHDIVDNVEHDLFDSSIVEYNDIQGIKIDYYVFRDEEADMDTLYGEATDMSYGVANRTKMTYEPTEESHIFQSFGMSSDEMIQFAFIPKTTFTRDVSAGIAPKPGDAVQTVWNSRTYEVVDARSEESVFQLKKLVWNLILKPFRYSEESDSTKGMLPENDSMLSDPLSAYGNNEWIDDESDDIDNYGDVDTSIYGY